MLSVLDIRVQKLFLIVLSLKVFSSGLGWYFGFPWSLGFWIPLALMSMYIMLGLKRHDYDVTDEKFADTCYYLGFIFTITSIIFSLFDLPQIGTKIQDIAVRFGAAMVSTVLGLGVRVYLVSFKRDAADATRDAEDAVVEASLKFREQLIIAFEKLRDFQSEVSVASKATVEHVNMQVEVLSKNHADKLAGFFADLTARNQEAFTHALAEVKEASLRLSDSVDSYSQGMRANLTSIETKVGAFTDAVTDRLKTTTFPDDYFSRNLAAPLDQLQSAANVISGCIQQASTEVGASSAVLSGALKKLRDKSNATERSLDTVLKLTEQQHAVLTTAQGQLTVLEQITSTLVDFDALFAKTLEGISASNTVTSELTARVAAVTEEGAEARKALDKSLADVIEKLGANARATENLSTQAGLTETASKHTAARLAESATMTVTVASKLDEIAAAGAESARMLSMLGKNASTATSKVDNAVEQLQAMVRQLASLDTTLRAQRTEPRDVVERIKDVLVTVEMPVQATSESQLLGVTSIPVQPNPNR